jgi:hypothetical protein
MLKIQEENSKQQKVRSLVMPTKRRKAVLDRQMGNFVTMLSAVHGFITNKPGQLLSAIMC